MPLPGPRAAALLAWVNSTKVHPEPLHDLSELRDCGIFIKIIRKLLRSEDGASAEEQPLPQRVQFVLQALQSESRALPGPPSSTSSPRARSQLDQ
ncbi:nuclear mitotic apparatus protein 1-like [Phaenicophaeus curvirostris]|uniref:nuclear mitotic apparatus protein 1-like n=1 Tax=Phaenicophaeus curvirostris TaxID=33595 RepID=UPI0037F0F19E